MKRGIAVAVSIGLLALAACGGGKSKPAPATHTLSGTVTRAWGGALAGVAVDLGGDATRTATTAADGGFAFAGLADGTYTLTPRRAGWVFTPAAPVVSLAGADLARDFTADGAYAITGAISGAATGGVTIALSGGGLVKPDATSAAGTGAYAFAGIPDGAYTLTPSAAGITFTPAAPVVTVAGASATQDFVAVAPLRLAGTVRDAAAQPLAGMTVRLTGARTALATTDAGGAYAFEGLTAGQDYTVTPATFGWTFDPLGGATGPVSRHYTLAASVNDADFAGAPTGPLASTFHGTLAYGGTRAGPVYVTVGFPFGGGTPAGGTGLPAQAGPFGGRAFAARNVQASGPVRVRAWMDVLGIGRYVAGADPAVTVDLDTAQDGFDLGPLTLLDPAPPAVASPLALGAAVPIDGAVVVAFDAPRTVGGDLVADAFTVTWADGPVVDAAHALGTITVPAGPDFAVVHGLANGTGYWFAVEAWLGGAPLAGQRVVTGAATVPGPQGGGATITGTVTYPVVAAPAALYVVAQSGQKGPAGGIWLQRIANPAGTQSDYALQAPPGRYAVFAFLDLGDDGVIGPGEPARFPGNNTVTFVNAVAGPNAGPALALPGGATSPSLTTKRYADAGWEGVMLQPDVTSAGRVPVSAVVTGPGLRGPLDLGLDNDSGGVGATLACVYSAFGALPVVGDTYAVQLGFADGSTEAVERTITGFFGGVPALVAPADGATGVDTAPTFVWSAPPGPTTPAGWVLEVRTQTGDGDVWGAFLPGDRLAATFNEDGQAAVAALSPFTAYSLNLIAVDADGNMAGYGGHFTTGAALLSPYDLLDGPTLDGQLWQTPQFTREVAGGQLVLGVLADDMQARTIQGITYTNAVNVQATGRRVTTLGATVTVPAATAGRSTFAVILGGIRLVYQPAAHRGLPFPDGSMDNLVAALELFDDGSGLRLRRRFFHCDDGGCAAFSGSGIAVVDPAGFVPQGVNAVADGAYDVPYTLHLALDEGTGVFTWTVQGGAFATPVSGTADVSTWAAASGLVLASTTTGFSGAQLYARASDDDGGSSGHVAPAFDDVVVGLDGAAAAAWDAFGAGFLDPSRWATPDTDVWLEGGRLHLTNAVTSVAAGAGGASGAVNLMYPVSFRAWQADVSIAAEVLGPTPDAASRAGMLGAFYNDGTPGAGATGDVRANITLATADAGWVIIRCGNPTCGNATGVGGPLAPAAGHPLGVGTVHTLGVHWDPLAARFTFLLDDAPPVTVDPVVQGLPGPVSPVPRSPLHLLSASTTFGAAAPAGSSARVEVTVDNVRGQAP